MKLTAFHPDRGIRVAHRINEPFGEIKVTNEKSRMCVWAQRMIEMRNPVLDYCHSPDDTGDPNIQFILKEF